MRDTEDAQHVNDLEDADANPDLDAQIPSVPMLHDLSHDVAFTVQQEDLNMQNPVHTTTSKLANGTTQEVNLTENFQDRYKDEYTDEIIPREWAEAAIQEEIDYFNDMVWLGVQLHEALADADAKIISARWVLCNNGDSNAQDVRARYVAQEVATHEDSSFYAATPPLESKRMLFSQWATERTRDGQPLQLSFADVRKAYFNGTPTRAIYVRLPKEMGLCKKHGCQTVQMHVWDKRRRFHLGIGVCQCVNLDGIYSGHSFAMLFSSPYLACFCGRPRRRLHGHRNLSQLGLI